MFAASITQVKPNGCGTVASVTAYTIPAASYQRLVMMKPFRLGYLTRPEPTHDSSLRSVPSHLQNTSSWFAPERGIHNVCFDRYCEFRYGCRRTELQPCPNYEGHIPNRPCRQYLASRRQGTEVTRMTYCCTFRYRAMAANEAKARRDTVFGKSTLSPAGGAGTRATMRACMQCEQSSRESETITE